MERQQLYKSASETVDVLRTKRRKEQSEIRREKREKILSFKRLRFLENQQDVPIDNVTVEEIIAIAKSIQKPGGSTLGDLRKLRNGFSQGSNLADAFLAQDGALQALVGCLTGNDAELQIEAAWCFTNLTGATQAYAMHVLKASGAYLITYLRGQNVRLLDLCSWSVGNLAGDSDDCRKMLRDQGAIAPLLNLLKSTFSNVIQSAAFAICNFVRGTEDRILEDLKSGGLGSLIYKLLKDPSTSAEIMTEICWMLTYFSVAPENIDYIFSCGIDTDLLLKLLSKYLEWPNSVQIITPILRTIGNICSGPDEHGTMAIKNGVLMREMPSLLSSASHHIRKESLWVLSNLTAGSQESLLAVLNAGLLPLVVNMLDGTFDIRKEGAIVLCNIAYKSEQCLRNILENGALEKFLHLLKSTDNELSYLALQFFEMMLRTLPESQESFEKAEGVSYLEALQYNRNKEICQCANDLMLTYFETEDDIQQ